MLESVFLLSNISLQELKFVMNTRYSVDIHNETMPSGAEYKS